MSMRIYIYIVMLQMKCLIYKRNMNMTISGKKESL